MAAIIAKFDDKQELDERESATVEAAVEAYKCCINMIHANAMINREPDRNSYNKDLVSVLELAKRALTLQQKLGYSEKRQECIDSIDENKALTDSLEWFVFSVRDVLFNDDEEEEQA